VKTVRIKPSRSASFFGMIIGLIMIGAGIKIIIPMFGDIGILWTLMAVAMTAYSAYSAFSGRGVATQEIDIEDSSHSLISQNDAADRLERLKRLHMDGLITEEEYQKKRSEIVNKL
jgi:Short C-terminal domain